MNADDAAQRGVEQRVTTLLVGDSIAFTIARAMPEVAHRHPVVAHHGTMIGCGIARGGPLRDAGLVINVPAECSGWPEVWGRCVDEFRPDITAVLVGRWEVVDRIHDGRWMHVGQPDYDAYLRSELQRGVDVLTSGGGRVALLSAPYSRQRAPGGGDWPQNDPARTDRFNQLLGEVAQDAPSVVTIDAAEWICPGGEYAAEVDGLAMRREDGIHLTPEGSAWVADRLLGELVRVVRSPDG